MESNTKKWKRERIRHAFSRHQSSSTGGASGLNPNSSQTSSPELSTNVSTVDQTGECLPVREKFTKIQTNNLWDVALQNISDEERAAIAQNSFGSRLDILQNIRDMVEIKRDTCEKKRWKFEFHGRRIILRDLADKVIKHIDHFKQVGDIVVSFDPTHAALPWAGVRFLLQVKEY